MVKPFVYFGTSEFAAVILTGLLKRGFKPEVVITSIAKAQGRGLKVAETPVASVARLNNLSILESPNLKDQSVVKELSKYQTELALLAAFGQIIPQLVLNMYPRGIINVHPSLLPEYRGASPIAAVLKDGLIKTGLSLMKLDNLMDHGPLLSQIDYFIKPEQTAVELTQALADLAAEILPGVLEGYLSGQIKPVEQDHNRATYTTLISRSDGRANFKRTAKELNNLRRAFTPWPGLWTLWQDQVVKLLQTKICSLSSPLKPGLVHWVDDKGLVIDCADNALVIEKLQLAGKKPLLAEEFIRGQKNFLGQILS